MKDVDRACFEEMLFDHIYAAFMGSQTHLSNLRSVMHNMHFLVKEGNPTPRDLQWLDWSLWLIDGMRGHEGWPDVTETRRLLKERWPSWSMALAC